MPGLRRLTAWWRARREQHLQRMASSDPRTHIAQEQTSQARRQRVEADRLTGAARDQLREIDALRAAVKAAKPQ